MGQPSDVAIARRPAPIGYAAPLLRWISALLLAWLIAGMVHEFLVLLMAALLPAVATSWPAEQAVRLLPLNRIYTQAILDLAATVDPVGLAISAPVGNWLHAIGSAFFVRPDEATVSGWVSAVIGPGSALPARLLIMAVADVAVLAAGLGFLIRAVSLRAHCEPVERAMAVGLVVQSVVVARQLRAPLDAEILEASGLLPFLYHEVLHLPTSTYDRTLAALSSLQPLLTLTGLLTSYLLAIGLVAIVLTRRRPRPVAEPDVDSRMIWFRAQFPALHAPPPRLASNRTSRPVVALTLVFAAALTPIGDLLSADTVFLETPAAPVVASAPVSSPLASVTEAVSSPIAQQVSAVDPRLRTPAVARLPMSRVAGQDGRFAYFVDGKPMTLRAMGYNVQYAGLPLAERIARYERDFAMLRDLGVDSVMGWRPNEFDEVLLGAAFRYNLGVIMPYDFDPAAQYTQSAARQAITADVLAWVDRYRHHPAVRMWAIGNETLMAMPSSTRSKAFAEFYRDLVLAVRSADPDHPVLYRDAEDVYLPHIQEAMAARGGPPTGFVYGMNFYTFRLKDVLADWSKKRFDVPVIVSEFAPSGVSRRERPDSFRKMWNAILAHRSFVIGAAPYVWTTEGPEPVDRLFGFVDAEGRPLDGTLDTFRQLYRDAIAQDTARLAVIPPLVGLPEADASQVLRGAGVAVEPLERLSMLDVQDLGLKGRPVRGRVFAQQPAAGTAITPGTRLRLTVIAPEQTHRHGHLLP